MLATNVREHGFRVIMRRSESVLPDEEVRFDQPPTFGFARFTLTVEAGLLLGRREDAARRESSGDHSCLTIGANGRAARRSKYSSQAVCGSHGGGGRVQCRDVGWVR